MSGRIIECPRCDSLDVSTDIYPPIKPSEDGDCSDDFIARHRFERTCRSCRYMWTEKILTAFAKASAA